MTDRRGLALFLLLCASACARGSAVTEDPSAEPDPFDVPIAGLSDADRATFRQGDDLFDLDLRDADGLGPLYTRQSCGACHQNGERGPGFVQRMAVVAADGVTPVSNPALLPFGNTVHPLLTAGATTPIEPPVDDPAIRVTVRTGPPVLGRGYLEAVDDAELLRVAAEQAARGDAIRGRVNHVGFASQPNPDPRFPSPAPGAVLLGRFGVKARIATLDDFTADALQNDMGITSPMRPTEFRNPDGLTDDLKPGLDVTADGINQRVQYLRMIAIPRRGEPLQRGELIFAATLCSVCHVPSLRTRSDYPVALIAGTEAPLYSDLLLHDMGSGLSDSLTGSDGEAGPQDWRTAPLIGLRFDRTFLHDGRATTLQDAIAAHDSEGSEASESAQRFAGLSADDQSALLDFLRGL